MFDLHNTLMIKFLIGITYFILSMSCVFILPAAASTNNITNTQAVNDCESSNVEIIVGGKVGIENAQSEENKKCFISTIAVANSTKSTRSLKLDKSVMQDKNANSLAVKVNLQDSNRIADRNNILNSELLKAIAQKNELLNKKINGQAIDELRLIRIEADISALQREIAR